MKTKRLFKEFINERKDWKNNPLQLDLLYLNIAYNLFKNNLVGTPKDTTDISIIYDNLVINNELITKENITEYDTTTLQNICNRYNKKYTTFINDIMNNNKIYLLNYYTLNDYCDFVECLKKFDLSFTYFNNNFEFIN